MILLRDFSFFFSGVVIEWNGGLSEDEIVLDAEKFSAADKKQPEKTIN